MKFGYGPRVRGRLKELDQRQAALAESIAECRVMSTEVAISSSFCHLPSDNEALEPLAIRQLSA